MNGRGDYKGNGRYKEAFGAFKGAQSMKKYEFKEGNKEGKRVRMYYEWKG